MSADLEATRYELRGAAAWITLDRPASRNALSSALVAELKAHLTAALADTAVRAIVLTGEGSAFCAGADLKSGGDVARPGEGGSNPFVDIMRLMREGPKPVICAVNGTAFGGGLGLIASADIAIAVDSAKFSFSEVRIGVIPAMISVVVLPKLGEHNTMRLFLTAERFSAAEALGYGLLHKVVPAEELEAAVDAEVAAIAKGGPVAVSEAKSLVREVAKLDINDGFAYAQAKIATLFASAEAAEGMGAFIEKRAPAWTQPDASGPNTSNAETRKPKS
jgi:methylglutaconyl-CoA hydratase